MIVIEVFSAIVFLILGSVCAYDIIKNKQKLREIRDANLRQGAKLEYIRKLRKEREKEIDEVEQEFDENFSDLMSTNLSNVKLN